MRFSLFSHRFGIIFSTPQCDYVIAAPKLLIASVQASSFFFFCPPGIIMGRACCCCLRSSISVCLFDVDEAWFCPSGGWSRGFASGRLMRRCVQQLVVRFTILRLCCGCLRRGRVWDRCGPRTRVVCDPQLNGERTKPDDAGGVHLAIKDGYCQER